MNAQKYKIDLGSTITSDLADSPAAEESAGEPQAAEKSSPSQSQRPAGLPSEPPAPMDAAAVAAVPKKARKQLNAGVPPELDLHRRTALYRMLHGMDAQDQVALALDAWLRDQGI